MLLCIFYLISLLSARIFAQNYFQVCYYGTKNKPAGNYKYESGKANVSPFYSNHCDSKEDCNFDCLKNEICYATSFVNQTCSFYNTTQFYVVLGSEIQYSKWLSCDTKRGYQPQDGRCEGLWVTFLRTFIDISSYPYLDSTQDEIWNCRKSCLENRLCGFINRLDKKCSFVAKWPVNNIIINTTNQNFVMDKWTCIDNFANDLQLKPEIIKPTEEKCSGEWKILSHNFTISNSSSRGLHFHTQIYKDCLEECNQYSLCSTVFYSFQYSFCILDNIEDSIYVLPADKIAFIKFQYKCVSNDSKVPRLNIDEKRYRNLDMDCYRIVETENLWIGKDKCGDFPSISEFAVCNSRVIDDWTITDSCLANQTYWAFAEQSISVNISGYSLSRRRKVFTGLQSYWLLYSGDNLVREGYLECRHFNASRPTERLRHDDILYRDQWAALPPNGTVKPFRNQPKHFLISASQRPFHSCKTRAACTDVLRSMQVSYRDGAGSIGHLADIPYNFLVDENGGIYECAGWHNENAAKASYSPDTISIAYIGFFKYALPNENVLNSMKKLIDYGVEHNFVRKDYKLFNVGDRSTHYTSPNIANVIKNFYRYKGFLPDDCNNASLLVILSSLAMCLIGGVVFIYLPYIILNYKSTCKTCKFLHQDLQWCKIFPLGPLDNSNQPNQITNISRNSKKHYIVHEKSTILSAINHRNIVKMIKLWFFNQFMETVNSRCSGNSLSNYLNVLLNIDTSTRIYETNAPLDSSKNMFSKIILVVNLDSNLSFYKYLICSRCCICHYFCIDIFDITNVTMDIHM